MLELGLACLFKERMVEIQTTEGCENPILWAVTTNLAP